MNAIGKHRVKKRTIWVNDFLAIFFIMWWKILLFEFSSFVNSTGIIIEFCIRFTLQVWLSHSKLKCFPPFKGWYMFFLFLSFWTISKINFYDYALSALVLKVNQSKSRLLKRDFDSSSNQKRIKWPETLLKHDSDLMSWDMYDVFLSVRK